MHALPYIRARSGSRDGVALIMVLAFIVLLSILIISFIGFTKLNRVSTATYSKAIQAQEIAQGGLQDILADLHQEIVAGSYTNSTVYAPNGGPMIYVPTTNITAMPARAGYNVATWGTDVSSPYLDYLSPTLIRVSRVSQDGNPLHFYPSFSTNTAYYDTTQAASLINRASAANTATPSANGRYISAARWNKTFLLAPTADTNSLANNNLSIPGAFATSYTPVGGSTLNDGDAVPPAPPYGPPDWVYVTRTGSRVCNLTTDTLAKLLPSNNTTATYTPTAAGANPTASPVIGRYAYIMYDEGALLDMNVAGYIATAQTGNLVSSPADPTTGMTQSVSGKSYLAYADLTKINFKPQTGTGSIDNFVQWRNASSVGSGNSYLNAVFSSYGKSGFLSFLANDSPLLGRQDLINYFANIDSPNFGTINTSYTCLPYMGTFTRDVNMPSYSPPVNASVLGGNNSNGTGNVYAYHDNAEISTATPFSSSNPNPNRDLANVRYASSTPPNTSITHYFDDTTTQTYTVNPGDPLIQSRFSLARINWLSSHLIGGGDPGNGANPDSGVGPSTSYATAIQSCFGLVWDSPGGPTGATTMANGGNKCWNYVGSAITSPGHFVATSSTPATFIETLDQVASEAVPREPNFFELLKASILSGSLGLSPGPSIYKNGVDSSGVATYLPNTSAADVLGSAGLFSYSLDGHTTASPNPTVFAPATIPDIQIIQIGANIIDQFDSDSYPTAIYFKYAGVGAYDAVSGTKANPIYGPVDMVYGDENLPDLTKIWQDYTSTHPAGNSNPTDNTDSYTASNGGTTTLSAWYQPELWNCHQQPSTALTYAPRNFQLRAYGSTQLHWHWDEMPPNPPYTSNQWTQGNAQSVSWFTTNSNSEVNNNGATINFIEGSATSSFYAHPYVLTTDSIPKYGAATVSVPITATTPFPTVTDSRNIAQPNFPYYAANGNLYHFAAFWAGTTPTPDPSNVAPYQNYWTDIDGVSKDARSYPTNSISNLFCNSFSLGWVDSSGGFHPYSFIAGAFTYAYNIMYSNTSTGYGGYNGDTRNGNVEADKLATTSYGPFDPRTTRFSTYVGWFSGQPVPPSNTTFYPMAGSRYSCQDGAPSAPSATGFYPNSTPNITPQDWAVNSATKNTTAGETSPTLLNNLTLLAYYSDPDGVIRPGDGLNGNTGTGDGLPLFTSAGTTSTAKGDTIATGDLSGNTQHGRRPVILNRPFRSVGELGYVFRDLPFKTLDFFTQYSADAALLDVFSINDEAKVNSYNQLSAVVAGRLSLSNAPYEVVQAVLSGAGKKEDFDPSYNMAATDSKSAAQKAINHFVSSSSTPGPLLNRADLVTRLMPTVGSTSGMYAGFTTSADKGNKTYFEAPIRALADVTNTRTWNLMIDVIAQAGHMAPNATTLDNFIVEGEKRYWLHIAIDRYTGKIVDQQLEAVYE